MNDDQLRAELERRSEAGAPDQNLAAAVHAAAATPSAGPRPLARLAPVASLAAVAVVFVLIAVSLPSRMPAASPTSAVASSSSPIGTLTPDSPSTDEPTSATPTIPPDADPLGEDPIEIRRHSCNSIPMPHGGPFYSLDDATGLAVTCEVVESVEHPAGPAVVRSTPQHVQVTWPGSYCSGTVVLRLSRVPSGFQAGLDDSQATACESDSITWTAISIGLPVDIDVADVSFTDEPVSDPGTWALAPYFRPTPASTRLHLVVNERQCASGEAPIGRVFPPMVDYGQSAVTLSFDVAVIGGDCPTAPGALVSVALSQPLADRRLVDGSDPNGTVVLEATNELLAIESADPFSVADERLRAALSPNACTTSVAVDRAVPTQSEIDGWAASLDGRDGLVPSGGYLGTPLDAARAFGALETYAGRPDPWYVVLPNGQPGSRPLSTYDSLILATLDGFPVSDGRTIWFDGFAGHLIYDRDCPGSQPSPSPSPEPRTVGCGRMGIMEAPPPQAPRIDVDDHTGLLDGCTAFFTSPGGPAVGTEIPNPANEHFNVFWNGTACDGTVQFRFMSRDGRYLLSAEPVTLALPCPEGQVRHAIMLRLTQPIATLIDVSISGTPGESPAPTPEPVAVPILCDTANDDVVLFDPTGFIDTCRTIEDLGPSAQPEPVYVEEYFDEGEMGINVYWMASSNCEREVRFSLRPSGTRFELRGELYEWQCGIVGAAVRQGMQIVLNTDMFASMVDASVVRVEGAPPALPTQAAPVGRAEQDTEVGVFAIEAKAGKTTYRSGEPIEITGSLVWRGAAGSTVEVLGGHTREVAGLVHFGWEQLGGDLRVGPSLNNRCSPTTTLTAGVPVTANLAKEGGTFGSRDPFWDGYFADHVFTLPPGRYRIMVRAQFATGSCPDNFHTVYAPIFITVTE